MNGTRTRTAEERSQIVVIYSATKTLTQIRDELLINKEKRKKRNKYNQIKIAYTSSPRHQSPSGG